MPFGIFSKGTMRAINVIFTMRFESIGLASTEVFMNKIAVAPKGCVQLHPKSLDTIESFGPPSNRRGLNLMPLLEGHTNM